MLRQIEYQKLLNEYSLGSYSKIHLEHIFKNYHNYYYELLKNDKLQKYCDFIQKDSEAMYENIIKEYNIPSPACWKIAEEWVVSKLTAKIHR